MKKIIFDLDNTLLFLSDEWIENVQGFINTNDINVDALSLLKTIDTYEDTMNDSIITKNDLKEFLIETLSYNISDEMIKKLLNCYNNIPLLYTEKIYNLLSRLSKKYELIAYTNWFTDDQKERLNKYNLNTFFSRIYGWDIIPAKPSLNGLFEIIGNEKPDNFISVGDNVKSDIELPSKIGMNTIFVNVKGIKQSKYKEILKIEELENLL